MYVKTCKICNENFNNVKKFLSHLKSHNINSIKEYIVRFDYGGIPVKCKCGYCDEDAAIVNGKFQKYASGHSKFSWKEEKYIELYGIPKCKTCGKPVNFKRGIPNKYCSFKCIPNKWNIEKCKESTFIHYGVINPFQSEEIKLKSKETKKKRYNNENYVNIEKSKETKKKRYNNENYTNRSKAEKTCLQNYGVKQPLASKILRDKNKLIMIQKYGVESPQQNKEIHEKTLKHALKLKKFKNTSISYQGSYELDFLEKYYTIFTDIERGASIKYIFNGKNKIYHSDFYIPSLNLIIECKNSYLIKRDRDIIKKKKEATINSGYKYILILDKDYSEFLELIKALRN